LGADRSEGLNVKSAGGLRHTHPNFWLTAVAAAVVLAWLGGGYLLLDQSSTNFRYVTEVAPVPWFGAGFLAASAAICAGMRTAPIVFRAGLAVGAGLNVFFAVCFLMAIIEDQQQTGKVTGSGAPALYGFLAVYLIAASREPRSNPDATR
jgi:hypothetical protein